MDDSIKDKANLCAKLEVSKVVDDMIPSIKDKANLCAKLEVLKSCG